MEHPKLDSPQHLAGGKPAERGDFVLQRRFRLASKFAPAPGRVLLDFGCGNGAQTRFFADLSDLVVGVDVDRAFLRQMTVASERGESATKLRAVLYDGSTLPLRDASVDFVISFEVLEHVADEDRALEELHRVMRPGASLVMSVPNRWWVFETHGATLPWLPWNRVPLFSWLPKSLHDRWAHARIYRRREIVAKIRNAGFEVRHSTYVTAPMDVVKWGPLRDALRGSLFRADHTSVPFLATAVLVIAER